jgi:3-oxoacyl-[acyl-carrier protein] reductase
MRLAGKTALITGGSKGIGRAIALRFAAEGAAIAVSYLQSADSADEVVRLARETTSKAIAIKADVSADTEARRLVEATVHGLGKIDILVISAGVTRRILHHDLEQVDEETWDQIFSTNVKGAFYCARAVIPEMLRIGGGAIINITSVAAFTGQGSSIPYCASKAAMTAITKSLARAFAPSIRVNAIAPGLVDTEFVEWPDVIAWGKKAYPLGRIVEPTDVADVAVFLAGDAHALTGQTIFVDCGVTALGPMT